MTIGVDSIQVGSRTITSGDGATVNITISSVDTSRAIVMLTWWGGNTGATRLMRHLFNSAITSATNLQLVRNTATSAENVTVEWTVIEFASASVTSLQTGGATLSATPHDITISAVTLAQTFVVSSTNTDAVQSQNVGPVLLTSTTNLRFDPASVTTTWAVKYQVVELTSDVAVQSGSHTFANNDDSDTITISTVDTGASIAMHSGGGKNTAAPESRQTARLAFTDSTTLAVDRINPGSDPGYVLGWQVVEFDGLAVETGTTTLAQASTSVNPTFTEIGADSAVFNFHHLENMVWGGDETNLNAIYHSIVLSDPPDDVVITREIAAATYDVSIAWWVVDFTAAGGGSVTGTLSATEGSDSLSASGSVALSATLVASEQDDSISASLNVAVVATSALVEADDLLTSVASGVKSATVDIVEDDDATSAAGSVLITASASLAEDSDSLDSQGGTALFGQLDLAEESDSISAAAVSTIGIAAALSEDDDALSSAVVSSISASLSATEEDDLTTSAAVTSRSASAALIEDGDILVAGGTSLVLASLGITEGDDALSASGTVANALEATFSATEEDDTVSAFASSNIVRTISTADALVNSATSSDALLNSITSSDSL